MERKRRAFYCKTCEKNGRPWREFLTPLDVAEGKHTPKCAEHGPMAVQSNRPYFGQKTGL